MNHDFDWDKLLVCNDEEQEGSDSEDSNSYQSPNSDSDEMGSDSKAENPNDISTELSKIYRILDYIGLLGMSLPVFLDALSWGDRGCIWDEKIKAAQTALVGSAQLSGILRRSSWNWGEVDKWLAMNVRPKIYRISIIIVGDILCICKARFAWRFWKS